MRSIAILIAVFYAALASAAEYTSVETRLKSWAQQQQMQASSPFAGVQWRAIGPAIQGGRVVDIEAVPGQENQYYVAFASGGVWKTTNNGQSFTPLSDSLPNMICGDLAIDPQKPDVLWLGSGEANGSRSSYSGLGIFKSDDGGKSFQAKGLAGADRIARVLVDPQNSERIIVAVQGPLYSSGGMRGVYLSENGGQTWNQSLKTPNDTTGAIELVFHPTNPQIVYAALWDKFRSAWNFRESGIGSGIYKSVDGGKTFVALSGFVHGEKIGRIGLAVSPAKPDWLYASVDNQNILPEAERDLGDSPLSAARLKNMSKDEFLAQDPEQIELFVRGADFPLELDGAALSAQVKAGTLSMDQLRAKLLGGDAALFNTEIRGLELYRSEDGGASFSKRHSTPIRNLTFTYGYYFGQLAVAPNNAEQVTLLGMPLAISDDGGKTFSGRLNNPEVHVDHHVWKIDPKNPLKILNGNDGGADLSYDGGQHWQRFDRQAVGQSYALALDNAEPYNVYTGLQDNGTVKGSSQSKSDDLEAWSFIGGGDGMQIQVDPRDNSVYTGYQFGNYQHSVHGVVRPQPAMDEPALRFNWQTPILLSSHNADVLYMGANKLFRSLDRGKTFNAISGDLTKSTQRGNVPFASLTSIAESPLQFGVLWAGTDDGQVWQSSDGGNLWRETGASLPDYWVSRVETSHFAKLRAYLSLNAYRSDNQSALVYVTDDMGKSWRSISKGLPDVPVNVVREDPINANVLYVGTDRGVFVSTDRGLHWDSFGGGLPNVAVHDLLIHKRDRELVAGTHGRSVWIADVLPLQELSESVRAKAVHGFYVNPVQFSRNWRQAPSQWFDRADDAPYSTLNFYAKTAGPVRLSLQSKDGQELRSTEITAHAGVNQWRWDLLVDADKALEIESKLASKATADAKEAEQANAKDSPYQQAKKYGWPLYIQPGEYQLLYRVGAESSTVKFTVEAPKALKPRVEAAPTIRGKK
jgi:photosystem II stability/assembly factor-like uncharacterized protein